MRKKVFFTMLMITAITLLISEGLMIANIFRMRSALVSGNQQVSESVQLISYEAMNNEMEDYLSTLSASKAKYANDKMVMIARSVNALSEEATRMFEDASRYDEAHLAHVTRADVGKTVTICAYGDGVNPEDAKVKREYHILSNLSEALNTINNTFPAIQAVYIATENGLYIGSEPMKEEYALPEGQTLHFEARKRPWYIQALEKKEPLFSSIFADADTGLPSLSYSAPFYDGNRIVGVCGAGFYLDDISATVESGVVKEGGFAFILNKDGQIVFRSRDSEYLDEAYENREDLRKSENLMVADMATEACLGNRSSCYVDFAPVNDYSETFLVSYSPMESIGWSFLMAVPYEAIHEPTRQLLEAIQKQNEEQEADLNRIIDSAILLIVVVILAVIFISVLCSNWLSKRLVAPIAELTYEVQKIQGDHLDFALTLNTRDEIQTLAESFGALTVRMKQYINDITSITAEKERIGAELSVAAQIQSDMLPAIFPPFPDHKEFDIYAVMDPAKEVGGDFYDFFMPDENTLVTVIADVSGKGVPAALFMTIAKTLIKNQAMNSASPAKILSAVNDQLCENNKASYFVTAWIGIMDIHTGKMICGSAGHEYPAIKMADGKFSIFKDEHGLPLAALEDVHYTEYELDIPENGVFFVYTDGVPEATNVNDELYEMDRMIVALNRNPEADPEQLLKNVREDIDRFVGTADQFDDLTMLCVKRRKPSDG
ncbi:MAG: SpoIIE family protein phosphatase [Lachnospiraceae bacterium]|nr:SpoIIE family protein phosphatase [Lachnospiraceae bacterium]